jgi:hypothetical protein
MRRQEFHRIEGILPRVTGVTMALVSFRAVRSPIIRADFGLNDRADIGMSHCEACAPHCLSLHRGAFAITGRRN